MPTTEHLQAYLTQLYAARTALLAGAKSYSIQGQQVTRADERWITGEIEKTERKLSRRGGGSTSARIVFDRGGR